MWSNKFIFLWRKRKYVLIWVSNNHYFCFWTWYAVVFLSHILAWHDIITNFTLYRNILSTPIILRKNWIESCNQTISIQIKSCMSWHIHAIYSATVVVGAFATIKATLIGHRCPNMLVISIQHHNNCGNANIQCYSSHSSI